VLKQRRISGLESGFLGFRSVPNQVLYQAEPLPEHRPTRKRNCHAPEMRLTNFIAIIAFAAPFKYAHVKARMH
jgi:hypothetical protein